MISFISRLKRPHYFIAIAIIIALVVGSTLIIKRKGKEKYHLVTTGNITEAVYGLGTVQAQQIFNLKIGVSSNVKKIYVTEGDKVTKGQKLVEFDSVPIQSSPIDGVVTTIYYKAGEAVFPQNKILTVMNIHDCYIQVTLEEQGAVHVEKNQKTHITFESLHDQLFEGEVKAIYPSEGQIQVRIELKEIPAKLLPGMSADVAIITGQRSEVIVVPARAIINNKVTKKDGLSRKILEVKTGITNGELTEIVGGPLKVGDILIIPEI